MASGNLGVNASRVARPAADRTKRLIAGHGDDEVLLSRSDVWIGSSMNGLGHNPRKVEGPFRDFETILSTAPLCEKGRNTEQQD